MSGENRIPTLLKKLDTLTKEKLRLMLRLDNKISFKKAFTNKLIFTKFVKDMVGIEIKSI